ncbi:MAG: site-specific integrase [Clostridiaceae bacterium]|nr:site-specific integrase [Clostridiaceae bacterium]
MASIQFIKDDKYRVFLCVNRRRTSKVIKAKSMKDAEKQAWIMERKIEETGRFDGETLKEKSSLHLIDLSEKYMVHLRKKNRPIKEKTRQKYQDILSNNILPYFKGYTLTSIDSYEIEKFQRFLGTPEARVNKSKKKPYAQSTISEIYKLLDAMLKKAVMWRMIPENPCDYVEKIVVEKQDVTYYSASQIAQLLKLIDEDTQLVLDRAHVMSKRSNYHPYTIQKEVITALMKQLIVNLAIKTTARRGEILGLRRGDIDLEKKKITYSRSVLYTKDEGTYVEKGLKTKDTNTVYINNSLAEMIKNYYQEMDKLFEVSGGQIQPTDLLFIALKNTKNNKVGGILFPDPISEWFKHFLQDHGMPPITFHKLRSSGLTYLANNGVDILTVAGIAGHSSTEVTERYYIEGYDSGKINAAAKFDNLDSLVKNRNTITEEEKK